MSQYQIYIQFSSFVVRVGIYNHTCVSVLCECICVFSVFRIVNETSTEAILVQGTDQLCCTNSWPGVHPVHHVVQLGLSYNNGPLVSSGLVFV